MGVLYVILGSDFSNISLNVPYIQVWGDDSASIIINETPYQLTGTYMMKFLPVNDLNSVKIEGSTSAVLYGADILNTLITNIFENNTALTICILRNLGAVVSTDNFFNGCVNLHYIYMSDMINVQSYTDMFKSCGSFLKINIVECGDDTKSWLISALENSNYTVLEEGSFLKALL